MVQILPTRRRAPKPRESHQRQLVDGSDPAYKKNCTKTKRIPPTAVGGWFRSCLQENLHQNQENPTNGSWWMVQILPTRKPAPKPTNPTNGSWWMVQIQPKEAHSATL
jgi:hypothetical protein